MTDPIKQATAELYAHLDCGANPRGKVARLLERIDIAADTHIALKHAYLRLEHQYMTATGTTAHEVWSWRPAGVFGDLAPDPRQSRDDSATAPVHDVT